MSLLKDFKKLVGILTEKKPEPIEYKRELPKTLGTDIREGRKNE